jgi:carbon monoxide dehydrogenase subunit G
VSQKTNGSVHIAAPVAAVVAVISDLENYGAWTDGMSDIVINKRDEAGRPVEVSFSVDASALKDRVTLSYVWGEDFLAWKLVDGKTVTQLDGKYQWQADGTGSQVTYELTADVSMSIPSFMKRVAEKTIVTTALQGLKKQVEATAS